MKDSIFLRLVLDVRQFSRKAKSLRRKLQTKEEPVIILKTIPPCSPIILKEKSRRKENIIGKYDRLAT